MNPYPANTLFSENIVCSFFSAAYIHMDRHDRKLIFGDSDEIRLQPVRSATETGKSTEILCVESLDTILYRQQLTNALIRLWGCAGWSAPLLFSCNKLSHRGPNDTNSIKKFTSMQGVKHIFTPQYFQGAHWSGKFVFSSRSGKSQGIL